MTLIEHIEVASSQSSITFSSIPTDGTYTDLYLVYSLRNDGNDDYWGLAFNGSTSNFTLRNLFGDGSSVTSDSRSDGLVGNTANPNNYTASVFSNGALYVPNYASTTTAKSISNDAVTENNATTAKQRITAMLWNNTTAISGLTLNAPPTLNFVQYSSATLFGITAGSDGTTTVS
jgi:hypothetical protein